MMNIMSQGQDWTGDGYIKTKQNKTTDVLGKAIAEHIAPSLLDSPCVKERIAHQEKHFSLSCLMRMVIHSNDILTCILNRNFVKYGKDLSQMIFFLYQLLLNTLNKT